MFLQKIFFFLHGDCINPGILNFSRITFLSLKKAISFFVDKHVKKWDKVLDFWCGSMLYKPIFLTKWITEYTGIDIGDSPEYNKWYTIYSWGKLPVDDNVFDIVISTQVFEHLENPEFYGQELERVIKNGGYMLITIAHVWEYHAYPKHYYNIFQDAIPLIFKNSEIVKITGDTTNIQNIMQMFTVAVYRKNKYFWAIVALIVNMLFIFIRPQPVSYLENPMTWNIILILKVTK